MKIWYSPYQLFPKGALNSKIKVKFRRGTLVRVRFEDGLTGYGDLCPLSEAGDPPLEHELRALSRGKPEPLAERSLYHARRDAEARAQERSLYVNDVRIKNHFLITDLLNFDISRLKTLEASGFSEFKLKMGRDLPVETELLEKLCAHLSESSHLRIDFNGALSRDRFMDWFEKNQIWLRPRLDFFEDPFVYNDKIWLAVSEKYNIRLALDQLADPVATKAVGAAVIVIKPAKQDAQRIVHELKGLNKKFLFTHYMDFPLGQMAAYAEAQQLASVLGDKILTCGLQHHDIYEGFTFQAEIKQDGPYILPPAGMGLGFDQLLDAQSWQDLL